MDVFVYIEIKNGELVVCDMVYKARDVAERLMELDDEWAGNLKQDALLLKMRQTLAKSPLGYQLDDGTVVYIREVYVAP